MRELFKPLFSLKTQFVSLKNWVNLQGVFHAICYWLQYIFLGLRFKTPNVGLSGGRWQVCKNKYVYNILCANKAKYFKRYSFFRSQSINSSKKKAVVLSKDTAITGIFPSFVPFGTCLSPFCRKKVWLLVVYFLNQSLVRSIGFKTAFLYNFLLFGAEKSFNRI